jgi:TPR repeat protein
MRVLYFFIIAFSTSIVFAGDLESGDAARAKDNYNLALKFYKKAAAEGNAQAKYNIGLLFSNGAGVALDYSEAMRWFLLASEQGLASAQFSIGTLYAQGNGVVQDFSEAITWYKLASMKNYAAAQYNLGFMYLEGRGVAKNYKLAHVWFNISASNGFDAAKQARDRISESMDSQTILEAQQMARECLKNNFKKCF